MDNLDDYDRLEDLPSLREGWIRLVHRCLKKSLGRNNIANIKENGLIFNRRVAEISPSKRGGVYDSPGYMVSSYNEELFWKKVEKDDFLVFDNAKYADTQIIFDMPIDEFCFLERFGKFAVGKIDEKYITGVIPNYNGYNKNITLSKRDVLKAKKQSIQNPPSAVIPSDINDMIREFHQKFSKFPKEKILQSIDFEKENLLYEIEEELKFIHSKEQSSLNSLINSKQR